MVVCDYSHSMYHLGFAPTPSTRELSPRFMSEPAPNCLFTSFMVSASRLSLSALLMPLLRKVARRELRASDWLMERTCNCLHGRRAGRVGSKLRNCMVTNETQGLCQVGLVKRSPQKPQHAVHDARQYITQSPSTTSAGSAAAPAPHAAIVDTLSSWKAEAPSGFAVEVPTPATPWAPTHHPPQATATCMAAAHTPTAFAHRLSTTASATTAAHADPSQPPRGCRPPQPGPRSPAWARGHPAPASSTQEAAVQWVAPPAEGCSHRRSCYLPRRCCSWTPPPHYTRGAGAACAAQPAAATSAASSFAGRRGRAQTPPGTGT